MRREQTKMVKMTREQNSGCKLTDLQIEIIKDLYKDGYSTRKIAAFMDVGKTAVWYWCVGKEKRDDINKKDYKKRKNEGYEYYNHLKCGRASAAKRRDLFRDELNMYSRERLSELKNTNIDKYNLVQKKIKEWKKNNPKSVKIWARRVYIKKQIKKYKEELIELKSS